MKFLILIFAITLSACYSKEPEHTSKEGKPLPEFKIQLSDSSILNTKDIATGKPFLIFIFGPHCPYSKAQMQNFVDNKKDLKGVDIIAITPYPFKQMTDFYQTYGIEKYPDIKMGIDPNNFFGTYISARAVPYIAVYNKDKKLAKAYLGITSVGEIKKAVLN